MTGGCHPLPLSALQHVMYELGVRPAAALMLGLLQQRARRQCIFKGHAQTSVWREHRCTVCQAMELATGAERAPAKAGGRGSRSTEGMLPWSASAMMSVLRSGWTRNLRGV